MAIARKKGRSSLYGSLSLLDKRKFNYVCHSKSSGRKESGYPIGKFLNKAAKNVTLIIILNLNFVFWRSRVLCSAKSHFSTFPWIVIKYVLVYRKCDTYCFHGCRNIDFHQSQCFDEKKPIAMMILAAELILFKTSSSVSLTI